MIDHILSIRLKPALERQRRRRLWLGAAIGLGAAAVIAALLLSSVNQTTSPGAYYNTMRWLLLPGGLLLGALGALIGWKWKPDVRGLGQELERQFPELQGRLTTALEQSADEHGKFSFLQEHLFAETIHHSTQQDWSRAVSDRSLRWVQAVPAALLLAFVALWWQLPRGADAAAPSLVAGEAHENGVEVTPGDTELEKGTALILLAKFHNQMPSAAELVIGESAESERRLPLTRSLSDPVYGGAVPEVQAPFSYKVSWDGGSTRAFKVAVFEYPKLERSDITLTYPDYTKLPAKRIEDTRHTSAVEGTKLDLELSLNKPVASAVLTAKKNAKDAAEAKDIALEVSPDKPVAVLRGHIPAQSARYELVLTDADGRRSKQAVPFSFDVVPNRVPELKLASPKGDQRPSALQEITFDGTVWDDFGVVACGLEVTTPGGEAVTVEFGKDVPAKEKRAFQKLLSMEDLSAVPDQLFAWHTWADDFGPDGKVRRTKGDLFFAEVRAFEEIFRQGEGMDSQQQQQQQQDQQQQQQGQQGQAEQLVKLQKQIITATWKLAQKIGAHESSKSHPSHSEDLKVIRDSQADAHSQAEAAAGEAAGSPATAALWQGALQNMQQALEKLEKAAEAPAELASAVAPEQAAYQALLKLKEREFQVSRQNRQQQQQQSQQGQSQGEQQQQQQLDQLDLAKNEDRYETQREAQAQQSAERREQMQVLNRLKELAQRQDDVNEKLKELQAALSEAKTEEEKEAARRELKRLEEEQRQMLADADELRQRMEQQQNQSETAEQREQLDQARENMQQAAEAAAQGQASQALASGTRAQEQMEQMREDLRKQSAGAFEEELRQMRADAREIARKQEEIAREMKPDQSDQTDQSAPKQPPSLGSEPPEDKLAEQLQQQEQRTGELVQRAQELSEQAEPSEPLLSRQIYEAARQFSQSDANAVKETQQELVREGRLSREGFDQLRELQEREQAGRALRLTNELQQQNLNREAARTGERAREGLNRLRDGIEQAAESVLGDDTAALRLAEQQLQEAAEAMQREMEQQNGQQPGEQNQQASAGNQRQRQQGQQQGNGQRPSGERQEGEPQTAQNEPREGQQETAQNEPREGQQESAQNQQGQQPGQRNGQQPQQGQSNSRQPGQRQGGNQPQNGEQPGERQPGEQNQELAQNEPQQDQQPREGQEPGEQPGQGQQPGERQGQGRGRQQGQQDQQRSATSRSGQRQSNSSDGGRGGGPEEDFIETARGPRDRRPAARDPLTGEGFTDWSDSLREAEELVDETELRNNIAQARERARQMRLEMRKAEQKPDWAVVQLEIVKPLVEVRDRVRQELARRESDKALVPVDRDPVPAQFSENVRRYYEQLGKE
jgi:hypothetical protein